uniref:glycosyltransferase family 2 protein n=1 Tax=Flavobacterium sp. TaxID=239 RepID=UPI00404B4C6D
MKQTQKTPFFSVIIPLYNKENFIEATVLSILEQTFNDYEIIIINDASTDSSVAKISQLDDNRIKIYHHQTNQGLSAARNTGIKNASSDYVCFLDADDIWKPTFLEKIHFLINQFPEASLFATNYETKINSNQIIRYKTHFDEFETFGIVKSFFKSSSNQGILNMSCLCVHEKVFKKIGGFDTKINFSEDIDFHIRSHAHFKLAYYNTYELTYNLYSENQITHQGIKNKILPDFDGLAQQFSENKDLVAYINFHRYTKGKLLKLANDQVGFKKLTKNLNWSDLNWKQRFLLKLPNTLINTISAIKKLFLKLNINLNSYE